MSATGPYTGRTVVVGVCGGIAAYKACEVVSSLTQAGVDVYVVMTEAATKLVAPLTFQTLSQHPVLVEMMEPPKVWNVEHIALAERADLLLIVPATANIVAKIANGICDDLLSTVVCAAAPRAPVLICPAMNSFMYANPIYQANEARLRSLGYSVLDPEYGRLASGAFGRGRLPKPATVVERALQLLALTSDYAGVPVLVTAGPTHEYFDPVRFLGNPSTGKMGFAVAEAAARRGADVTLVTGPVRLADPPGVKVIRITSAEEMLSAATAEFAGAGLVVAAAAVSDYRPVTRASHKLKKSAERLEVTLERTPDVLAALAARKGSATVVGFAAESDRLVEYGQAKMAAKSLDLVVANDITQAGAGFALDTNIALLLWPDGHTVQRPLETKRQLAWHILDVVLPLVNERR